MTEPVLQREQARRLRVIEATRELLEHGGYDALQMRDVAARSRVGLATIYKDFQSRDHLIFQAINEFYEGVEDPEDVGDGSPPGATTAERYVAHMWRSAERRRQHPELLRAWVRSTTSNDPHVVAILRGVDWQHYRQLIPPLRDLDPQLGEAVMRSITKVWYAGAVRWTFDQQSFDAIYEDVEQSVRLILANSVSASSEDPQGSFAAWATAAEKPADGGP